ncbi:MAG: aspartate carbamoyltransferase catalytic subunit [Acidaminococcaceae bacterium]|nr:aspartate carbamoyltransferase catalytic subunit [Acidaminococcaceae bacterium]HAY61323.1 aspartate carbamoyltransferase [Acidaminococcaceae bacterium]
MAKANVSLGGRDILDLESLSVDEINLVENTAMEMKRIMKRDIKKVPALRGKLIITLFYEPSTRTRTSFETAAKYLGADVINITTGNSSVVKGECLRDTILTLENMGCDGIIMRSPCEGAACYAAQVAGPVIINAGDGAHAHPSQGLLDLFTLREHGIKDLKGKKMVILGDVLFSRVARSNIACWKKFGADIHVAGPRTLMPWDVEALGVTYHARVEDALEGADVIDVLRIQLERQNSGLFPSMREYAREFGLNEARYKLANPGAVVLHPGPMNRGTEISFQMGYHENALIRNEVQNGVAVRMALEFLTLTGGNRIEAVD